ncbi:hypothetical protein LguiA_032739 [Lonicera macranthoides]
MAMPKQTLPNLKAKPTGLAKKGKPNKQKKQTKPSKTKAAKPKRYLPQRCIILAFAELVNQYRKAISTETWEILNGTDFGLMLQCFRPTKKISKEIMKNEVQIMDNVVVELSRLIDNNINVELQKPALMEYQQKVRTFTIKMIKTIAASDKKIKLLEHQSKRRQAQPQVTTPITPRD